MSQLIPTDVFKFVAIRPAQRVTENETRRTIIRDPRATNPEGTQQLRILAHELATSEAALIRWRELDLASLEPLVDGYRELVRRYEKIDAGEDPPVGSDLLKEVGVLRTLHGRETTLLSSAWDALYTADRTGPDAGSRLETPMAALRVLHFAQLLNEEPKPSRAAALEALGATPAIPTVFHDALLASLTPAPRSATGTSTVPPNTSERSTRLRWLAQELDTSGRLLDAVTNAPALAAPAVQAGSTEAAGGWSRSQFALRTVPTLSSALSGQLTHDQAMLLDRLRVTETTPIPIAAQTLQVHLAKLSEQAFALSGDQEFQGYLREFQDGNHTTSLSFAAKLGAEANIGALLGQLDPSTAPDVNVAGRIVPLGIGDLKVVKQTLLAYVPGEVAHIENVLKGESKERKHRTLDRTETTLFTSEEETKETERDTQSTDRFELKREAEQTIKEDMSVKAGLTVTATFGPVVTTATGDFAYSTSKQDSQKSSSNFAREVVDRSVSKVQTKTKTERTTKTLSEVEEINTHGVNNTKGAEHVIGIYRWVDKRYRAQVYNYGVRLLLEFIVPEPAAFYRAAQLRRAVQNVNATPPEPFLNLAGQPLEVKDIDENTYKGYASRYNAAGVTPPSASYTYVGASLVKDGLDEAKTIGMASKDFVVPSGYVLQFYSATVSILWKNFPQFSLQIGRDPYVILNDQSGQGFANMSTETEGLPDQVVNASGSVPVSIGAYDVKAFAVNVQGYCKRTDEELAKWQLQTFDKIYTAYQALQTAYDQKVEQAAAAAGITMEGRNPAMNRIIEKTELKKLCITMMTGQHFKQFHAMTDPADKPKRYPEVDVNEALNEGPIIQFFEQAFEWEQMTYLFYPYFWGRKENWVEVSQLSDPDPIFAQFLTAGAARVVVPVPIAYADAVQYLLQSNDPDLRKRVWRGGERPTIGSDLYISITEEMRNQTDDLAGATPEGEPWEFTLPTTLVWLQPDSTLPSFA